MESFRIKNLAKIDLRVSYNVILLYYSNSYITVSVLHDKGLGVRLYNNNYNYYVQYVL